MLDARLEAFLKGELQTHKAGHSGRTLYAHLQGTYDLLEEWGNPQPVCDAGLFHSVYGTWHFRHRSLAISSRQVVQDLIGAGAERLVYLFCVTQRPKALLACATASVPLIVDHYQKESVELTPRELDRLLEIEAANLIEQGGNIAAMLQSLLGTRISQAAKAHVAHYLASGRSKRI